MKPVLICTPTWNKADFFGATLASLRDTADPSLYRHVIIDNGSHDRTAEICQAFSVERIFNRENRGVAGALNQGVAMLEAGQHFMKLDDDVTFSGPGWLFEMACALERLPFVGGVALPRQGREKDQLLAGLTVEAGVRLYPANRRWWTNCALYRWEAVQDLGSFWQPGLYGFEDVLTGTRLRKLGWGTVYLADFSVRHEGCWMLRREPREYVEWKGKERHQGVNIRKLIGEFEQGIRPAHIPLLEQLIGERSEAGD